MRLSGALRKWGRRWVYVSAQLGLSVLAWAYIVIFVASMLLMVLIVGLVTAPAVLALARALANWSLAGARWVRARGETATIPATFGERALTALATSLLRSPMTWKSVTYLLINAVVLPAHVVAFIIFPLAGLWARAHAWFTIRMLGPALGVRDMADAASPAASPGSGQVRGGFGLAGMGERVAALGGRLTTGPDPAGGFSVRAVLPLTSVSLAEGGAEEAGDGIGQGDGAGGRSDGAGSGGAGSGSVSGDGTRGESS